jgi:hypothetical protein
MKQCLCKNRTKEIQAALTRLPPTQLDTDRWIRTIAAGVLIPTAGLTEVVNPRPTGYTDFASTLVNTHVCCSLEKSGPSYGATKTIKGKKQPSETTSPLE